MDFETNLREVLTCFLPNVKDEVIDAITEKILSIKTETTPTAAYNLTTDDLNNIRIMGYTVTDLIIVAERLKTGGADLMQVKRYTDGFKDGYARANANFEKAISESVNRIVNGLD